MGLMVYSDVALLTFHQVLYAWSAPDVLFVSMFTATLELDQFVAFAIGDRCDTIDALLRAVFDKVRICVYYYLQVWSVGAWEPADIASHTHTHARPPLDYPNPHQALDGDDVCFDMQTAMAPGIWLFGVASLTFFATGALVLRNAHRLLLLAAAEQAHVDDGDGNNEAACASPLQPAWEFASPRCKGSSSSSSCCRGWDLGWGRRHRPTTHERGGDRGSAPLLQGEESKWAEEEEEKEGNGGMA